METFTPLHGSNPHLPQEVVRELESHWGHQGPKPNVIDCGGAYNEPIVFYTFPYVYSLLSHHHFYVNFILTFENTCKSAKLSELGLYDGDAMFIKPTKRRLYNSCILYASTKGTNGSRPRFLLGMPTCCWEDVHAFDYLSYRCEMMLVMGKVNLLISTYVFKYQSRYLLTRS